MEVEEDVALGGLCAAVYQGSFHSGASSAFYMSQGVIKERALFGSDRERLGDGEAHERYAKTNNFSYSVPTAVPRDLLEHSIEV
jgi:hypothetical protein